MSEAIGRAGKGKGPEAGRKRACDFADVENFANHFYQHNSSPPADQNRTELGEIYVQAGIDLLSFSLCRLYVGETLIVCSTCYWVKNTNVVAKVPFLP